MIWFVNSNIMYGTILKMSKVSAIVKVDMKDIKQNLKVDLSDLTILKNDLIVSWDDKNGENTGKIVEIKPKTCVVNYPLDSLDNRKSIPYSKITKINENLIKGGSLNITFDYDILNKKYDFEDSEDYKNNISNKGSFIRLILTEKRLWNFNGDISYKNLLIGDIVSINSKNKKNSYDYDYTGIITKITNKFILVEDNSKNINKIVLDPEVYRLLSIIKLFRKNYNISWLDKKIQKDGIIVDVNMKNITVKN